MKNLLLILLLLFTFFNCNTEENNIPLNPIPPTDSPILTENIEVYNADLIDNNLTFAIENGGTEAYLIDKEGNKIKEWIFESNLGNDLEILPDGRLIGIFKPETATIEIGGYGGIARIINTDNEIDWEFEYNSSDYISHHDIELLPNGNVLLLVWERIDMATAQAAGLNVTYDVFPEKLMEIDINTNTVVWEWRSWNHLVQDFDANAANFGNVANNPQLINPNYALFANNGDIMHANGIDYDASKDVIYLSVNFFNEVWVIDHSTTTVEATTNTGGNYNKGGNLIYRFGNPLAYNNTMGEVRFNRNHYPNYIEDGDIGEGNILVYANGNNVEQSTVYELEMPTDFNLVANQDNEPVEVWSFTNANMFSDKFSGAVRLSNGNTLICEGDYGFWEITPNGEIAWKYNGLGKNFWRCYDYELSDPAITNLGLSF